MVSNLLMLGALNPESKRDVAPVLTVIYSRRRWTLPSFCYQVLSYAHLGKELGIPEKAYALLALSDFNEGNFPWGNLANLLLFLLSPAVLFCSVSVLTRESVPWPLFSTETDLTVITTVDISIAVFIEYKHNFKPCPQWERVLSSECWKLNMPLQLPTNH